MHFLTSYLIKICCMSLILIINFFTHTIYTLNTYNTTHYYSFKSKTEMKHIYKYIQKKKVIHNIKLPPWLYFNSNNSTTFVFKANTPRFLFSTMIFNLNIYMIEYIKCIGLIKHVLEKKKKKEMNSRNIYWILGKYIIVTFILWKGDYI